MTWLVASYDRINCTNPTAVLQSLDERCGVTTSIVWQHVLLYQVWIPGTHPTPKIIPEHAHRRPVENYFRDRHLVTPRFDPNNRLYDNRTTNRKQKGTQLFLCSPSWWAISFVVSHMTTRCRRSWPLKRRQQQAATRLLDNTKEDPAAATKLPGVRYVPGNSSCCCCCCCLSERWRPRRTAVCLDLRRYQISKDTKTLFMVSCWLICEISVDTYDIWW